MKHIYWIKFRDDTMPHKYVFESLDEQLFQLREHMMKYGWIEWMQRD